MSGFATVFPGLVGLLLGNTQYTKQKPTSYKDFLFTNKRKLEAKTGL